MRRFAWIGTSGLALPALAIAVGGGAWPFELAYHFVGHLLVVAGILSAACLWLRQHAPAAAAGLLMVIYGTLALDPPSRWIAAWAREDASGLVGADQAAEPAVQLTLVSFNLLADHENPGAMLAWLATAPGDVLVLVEASSPWRAGFERLRGVYPHQAVAMPLPTARGTGRRQLGTVSGVAILSRMPLGQPRALYPAGPDWPAIAVELESAAGPVIVVGAHPPKPLTRAGLDQRDRYLEGLGAALAASPGPLILAGDFNATRYTPIFRRLRSELGLTLTPTSPATFPARFGPLGLAIDHVLVRDARFDRLDPLPARGSDHRGLYARLGIPQMRGQGAATPPGSRAVDPASDETVKLMLNN